MQHTAGRRPRPRAEPHFADLRRLLATHQPPWSIVLAQPDDPYSAIVLERDGAAVEIAAAPRLRAGLVAAFNLAVDYLEVQDDRLAEEAEDAAADSVARSGGDASASLPPGPAAGLTAQFAGGESRCPTN
jgi:hypothetical protein